MLFEDLGPTYIKLGQILSSRPDLLAERYRAELAHLQDDAPAEPDFDVISTIEAQLGRPFAEVFADISPTPFASASIGQAFGATRVGGADVVVKLRRRGVVEQVRLDLELLTSAARHVGWVWPAGRRLGLANLAAEFAETLLCEMDFEIEARNAERFARNLEAMHDVAVPRVHWHATTQAMLTLDRVVGRRIDDPVGLSDAGLDGREAAERLVALVLHMVVRDGYFHADPHPGNLLLAPDATIGLIDFGMVGELSPELKSSLAGLLSSMASHDVDGVCASFVGLGIIPEANAPEGLRDDLALLLANYGDRALGEVGFGAMLHDHLEVARRHGLRLPAQLALLTKVLLMTEGLAARLDPAFEALRAFASFMGTSAPTHPSSSREL